MGESIASHTQVDCEAFTALACLADLEGMRSMVHGGFDLKSFSADGKTILASVIEAMPWSKTELKIQVVQEMLRLGADARQIDGDGLGPLFSAILDMDTPLVQLLLDAGADPNQYEMDFGGESLYDWAEFDYRYEIWNLSLPEEPCEQDRSSEDAWLAFLDRIAVQHGKLRPTHLFILRERGALMWREIRKQREGS